MKWKAFCNLTSLVIGTWQSITSPSVEQENSMKNPWFYCPKTYQRVLETNIYNGTNKELEMIADHLRKYNCPNRTYSFMKYVPEDCQLRTVRNSLHKIDYAIYHHNIDEEVPSVPHIQQHPHVPGVAHANTHHGHHHAHNPSLGTNRHLSDTSPTVAAEQTPNAKSRNRLVYVGDSLSAQSFIAGTCLIEQFGYQQDILTSYVPELWLRPDIPCIPECIDNSALYSKHKEMFNPCAGCYKGKYRPFDVYSHHPRFWYQRIPNDTLAVIMGNGAWYNGYKGVIDSNKVFEETMVLITPLIQTLINVRNISVFWVSLPPTAQDGKAEYEWMHFRQKDSIVKKHLEPLGVMFIDEMALLNERKLKDPQMNPDGFHWWYVSICLNSIVLSTDCFFFQ
jgi:hypothetical protein